MRYFSSGLRNIGLGMVLGGTVALGLASHNNNHIDINQPGETLSMELKYNGGMADGGALAGLIGFGAYAAGSLLRKRNDSV